MSKEGMLRRAEIACREMQGAASIVIVYKPDGALAISSFGTTLAIREAALMLLNRIFEGLASGRISTVELQAALADAAEAARAKEQAGQRRVANATREPWQDRQHAGQPAGGGVDHP